MKGGRGEGILEKSKNCRTSILYAHKQEPSLVIPVMLICCVLVYLTVRNSISFSSEAKLGGSGCSNCEK